MNFCKPSTGPPVNKAPAFSNRAPHIDSDDHEDYSYQSSYNRPGFVPKASEDYGLSSNDWQDTRDRGITRPPISISTSGRVLDNDGTHLPTMRGDASLRPNTGNSNQSAGDALGSLQEITTFLRWMTICSTCAAVIWEGFAFPLRLISAFFTDPSQAVLGGYLGFFCLLMLGGEFNNKDLKDNFGFLYFPLSRGMVLLMMSGMCLGILDKWWESLLGLAFGCSGIGYIYAYIKYPEYRRWQHYNERMPTAWRELKMYWNNQERINTASWADPRNSTLVTPRGSEIGSSSETQSLLYTI